MPPTCHVLQVRIASVMTCHDKCSTLNSCESALPYLPWQDLLGLVPCPSARSLSRSCCKMPAGFHGRFKCLYIWNAWYAATTSQISQFTALFQTSKPVNFEVSSDCTNLFGCRMCTCDSGVPPKLYHHTFLQPKLNTFQVYPTNCRDSRRGVSNQSQDQNSKDSTGDSPLDH